MIALSSAPAVAPVDPVGLRVATLREMVAALVTRLPYLAVGVVVVALFPEFSRSSQQCG